MSIAKFSVNRPVTTTMFFSLCFLLGVLSWQKLPRELFPPLSFPQLNIVTVYPNAAPEEIENLITKTIEEAIGTVKDIKRITSVSKEGASVVTAEFGWNTNMDFASLWVREKLDQIKEQLPPECKEPIVVKYNPLSQPVLILNVTANMPANDILQICNKIIKDRIEKTEGVASVEISGGEEKQILVEVDQGKLLANQIPINQVVEAIKNANINYPAGTTNEKLYEYLIRTIGEYKSIGEIGETVVETTDYKSGQYKYERERERNQEEKKDRRLIRLSSIANIKWAYKDKTSYSRYNGSDNISIAVRKRAEYNTIFAADNIKNTIKNLQLTLKGQGVSLEIAYDQSEFIKSSIKGLMNDAIQGGVLSFAVVYLFLNNIILSLIVCVSIPMSIFMSLALMYFSGISLNSMSLGGLALGVGMMVDTTIVVIENASRHNTDLKNLKQSAVKATDEVTGAIFASNMTTIAVFLPLLFVVGIAGQIFKQLSLSVIYTQLVSILVALSLVPRLISALKHNPFENTAASGERGMFKEFLFSVKFFLSDLELYLRPRNMPVNLNEPMLLQYYKYCINWVVSNRKKFFFSVTAAFLASLIIISFIDRSFLPDIDQGQFIIKIDLPVGSRLEVTNSAAKKVETALGSISQIKSVMVQAGSTSEQALETLKQNQAHVVVSLYRKKSELPPNLRRTRSVIKPTKEVVEEIRKILGNADLGEAKTGFVMQDSFFKSIAEKSYPIIVRLSGQDMEKISDTAYKIIEDLKKLPGVVNINDNIPLSAPETKIDIDKDKASTYNLSVADIARTSLIALRGMVASKFKDEGNEYDITVRLSEKDRKDLGSLESLLVSAPRGFNFPVKSVARIIVGKGPSEIRRIDQQRTVLVNADLAKVSMKKISNDLNGILNRYKNIQGLTVSLGGETEKIRESFFSLFFILGFAILLVYMIMASQFESLYQPLIILLSFPLAIIGVAVALLVTNTSLNAISAMGIIILGGIVVNNGIVLIDYINQLRSKGVGVRDAVIEASVTRLRPILMTASTTVLGLLPLALGLGDGAELRSPMAVTVMGGLIGSTILTLGFIPLVYLQIEEWKQKRSTK